MDELNQSPIAQAPLPVETVAPPVATAMTPAAPVPPASAEVKKSNTGLLVILGVVVVALLILGGVTYFALQGSSNSDSAAAPTAVPTALPTTSPTPTTAPNSDRTSDIKKDLDQTTVTDPATEVNSLTAEVNKL